MVRPGVLIGFGVRRLRIHRLASGKLHAFWRRAAADDRPVFRIERHVVGLGRRRVHRKHRGPRVPMHLPMHARKICDFHEAHMAVDIANVVNFGRAYRGIVLIGIRPVLRVIARV